MLSQNKISSDFKFLKNELTRIHPNPYMHASKKSFFASLDELTLEAEKLSESAFLFKLMEVFANLKDSHTRVKGIGKVLSGQTYPIRVKKLEKGYFVCALMPKIKRFIGSQVISLNGVDVQEVSRRISSIVAFENEVVLSNAVEQWIYEPDLLQYLDIVDESLLLELTLRDKDGNEKILELAPNRFEEDRLFDPRSKALAKSETLKIKGRYWSKYYTDISTYYLQYNQCEEISKDEIDNIIKEIRSFSPANIVIDLRNNLGGSSLILDPLTKFLYENQEVYKPFVLISNDTYSAAIINALNILDCKNAVSIGVPTAGSPTKFGETVTVTLPESEIDIVISTKFFEEKGYKYGQPLVPQSVTSQTIDQYLNATDVDWDRFLELIR